MTAENRIRRIYKLQKEYFEFGVGLFQRLPKDDELDIESLWKEFEQLRTLLKVEIEKHLQNCKCETIQLVENEILRIRELIARK